MTATTIATVESVNALLAGTTIAPIALPKPKAAKAAKTVAKKRSVKPATIAKDAPVNVKTKNGGMMDSRPGTITKGQLSKLVSLCEKIGEPLAKDEIDAIRTWSMAAASDYRFEILNPEA